MCHFNADEIYSVAYSPDGSQIVSGSIDNTLKLWDALGCTTTALATFTGHTGMNLLHTWVCVAHILLLGLVLLDQQVAL